MFDDLLWALILVVVLVLVVRGLGGPRSGRPEEPMPARLAAVETELRELKAQLRLLVERVWFLEQDRDVGLSPPPSPTGRAAPSPGAEEGAPSEAAAGVAASPSAQAPLSAPLASPAATSAELPSALTGPRAAASSPHVSARRDLEQRIGARWTTGLGILIILFALAFFFRWALERDLLGSLPRVLVGVAAGVLLLAAGQRQHRRRDLTYLGAGLSGGGLGALYLSLYAAHVFYAFIGPAVALGLMFVVTIAGGALAFASDRQATAILALLGGLLTPVLLASGPPDERVLLGYLLVLDCLALVVARYRSWPTLGYLAWAGTAVLVVPSLFGKPAPGQLAARLLLLTVIWALFVAQPMLRERVAQGRERALDFALVWLNAAGYFYALHTTLGWWAPAAQGPAALCLAAVYGAVADQFRRRDPADAAGAMTHLGVGVVFLTLGLGLSLRGPWITLAWAAQGLALLAIAPRVGTRVASWGGLGALLLSAARVLWIDTGYRIVSFLALGLVLLGVSYLYQRMRPTGLTGDQSSPYQTDAFRPRDTKP
jgi:uncharacterized membrane protein